MIDLSRPINLTSREFVNHKFEWYEQIREKRPVHRARIGPITLYTVSRYKDCTDLLKNPLVFRNRKTATGGGSRFFIPMPKSMKPIAESMIQEDDPNHRRLRELVRRAFRPQAIAKLEQRIDAYSHELLDSLAKSKHFDLQTQYALPIPVRMIGDMIGVSSELVSRLRSVISVVTDGFSSWRLLRSLLWDMPKAIKFVRYLVQEKRHNPGDDILTGLIEARDDHGDQLTEDEIVGMVFLLIIAGFETTVHLITNGVLTLLQHPEQLEQLKSQPELIDSAVEEILRHRGPIQGTKPGFSKEDITLHGVTIPKGKPIIPLLCAANHDPEVFAEPQVFDIQRSPNHHLGFGHGVHFCLGAHLARMETKLAIQNLFERMPNLQLAVDDSELQLQRLPLWHRYNGLPVVTKS